MNRSHRMAGQIFKSGKHLMTLPNLFGDILGPLERIEFPYICTHDETVRLGRGDHDPRWDILFKIVDNLA